MVRMMEGVLTHGTGVRADIGRPAAGKTGTTSDYRDAWFVGFTPDWVCGVWLGNDDNAPMNHLTGGQLPAEIWKQMMLVAHRDLPVRDFDWMPPPDTDVSGPPQVIADAPPSDADAAEQPAQGADADPRKSFYGDLSSDFDQAAQGGDAGHRRPPAPDPTQPEDRAPPRQDQQP
jgi:penicillin-binding protein 1A